MPVTNEYELFDFDSIEDGLVAAVKASVGNLVGVFGKHNTETSETPYVYLTVTTGSARQNKRLVVPNIHAEIQPYDSFDFTFSAEIVTQRELNGVLHRKLIAQTRMAMQLYKLAVFGAQNPQYWPYHTIRDIAELDPSALSTDGGNTTDSTTLNFRGWFNIAPDAWPDGRPETPALGDNALVSGAGTEPANGLYTQAGDPVDGRYVYQKSSQFSASPDQIEWDGGEWFIQTYLEEGGSIETVYRVTSDALTPWGLTMTAQSPGIEPVPTITQN